MGGKGSGRPKGAKNTSVAPCGTKAAYQRHRRHGEIPCAACKQANRDYYRLRQGHKPRKPKLPGTSNQRWAAQYKEIVRRWKLDQASCVGCGFQITNETLVCIDCDHINPNEKSFTISYETGRWADMQRLIDELIKCQALCKNCHALRTQRENHHLARREAKPSQAGLFDE
jgi:hypothetical protein